MDLKYFTNADKEQLIKTVHMVYRRILDRCDQNAVNDRETNENLQAIKTFLNELEIEMV